jgi:crotonobetainyl-CoA:carnitine CoA-transferase CaiB-like acyl-CoA transferase
LRELFAQLPLAEISRICEASSIGFAPIRRPDELLDDPQLAGAGAMIEVSLPGGGSSLLPALPIEMDGRRLHKRLDIPRVGEHSAAIARELGIAPSELEELVAEGVLGLVVDDEKLAQ